MKEYFQECDDMLQKYEDKVQERQEEIEELKNELDVKWMQYLSQVSMWKSRAEELERCLKQKDEQFIEYLNKKCEEFYDAYSNAYKNKLPPEAQAIYRKYAGIYNKEATCADNRMRVARGEITIEEYNDWVKYNIDERPSLYNEDDLIKPNDDINNYRISSDLFKAEYVMNHKI